MRLSKGDFKNGTISEGFKVILNFKGYSKVDCVALAKLQSFLLDTGKAYDVSIQELANKYGVVKDGVVEVPEGKRDKFNAGLKALDNEQIDFPFKPIAFIDGLDLSPYQLNYFQSIGLFK